MDVGSQGSHNWCQLIESLTRQAYAHIPPSVHICTLSYEASPTDQTGSSHRPSWLILSHYRKPCKWFSEGDCVGRSFSGGVWRYTHSVWAVVHSSPEQEKPARVAEITEVIRAVALQTVRNTRSGPMVCWRCGQPGHLGLPHVSYSSGNWVGVCVDGAVQTPGSLFQTPPTPGGCQRHRQGSKAPLPPEAACRWSLLLWWAGPVGNYASPCVGGDCAGLLYPGVGLS